MIGKFSHRNRVISIGIRYGFRRAKLRAVVTNGNAKAQPVSQMSDSFTHMPAANHNQ